MTDFSVFMVVEYREDGQSFGVQIDEIDVNEDPDAQCEGCFQVIGENVMVLHADSYSAQSAATMHLACGKWSDEANGQVDVIHLITTDLDAATAKRKELSRG